MPYRSDLGFQAETLENIIERLRIISREKLGYSTNTADEFVGSNIWLIYYAVALMKNQTDMIFEEVIDKLFDYFLETYGSLQPKEGSSGNGFKKLLLTCTQGYELQTYQNNKLLQPGQLRVALQNPDIEKLTSYLTDFFDFTIQTDVGDPVSSKLITCDVGIPVNFYYMEATKTPLYIMISYELISSYVPTGNEKEIIKGAFIKRWEEFQTLGKDFMPDAYIGNNEELYFLESIKVGYKVDTDPTKDYTFEVKIHEFGEYFTIQKEEDGTYYIEIVETQQ